MDKFIVSARKYRPQNFNTVVGQAHITTTLKNAIKNQQLAHAFLFCGPRGVGKTTCARILAKTINCTNKTADGEACNVCNSCTSFDSGTSLNIHELDAASNNSVDDIRVLVEQVRFAPQAGDYKVYIVDEVHMLSASAFNAFLKTLEEPPAHAIFILATTEKHKILPTILSRCQIFDFKRITTQNTVEHLQEITHKENITADTNALHLIAQKSEGCMRDALSILDKIVSFTNGTLTYSNTLEHLNILDHDYYFKLLQHLQNEDLAAAIVLYDEINNKGFEGDMVLNGLAEFLRNILICKDERAIALLDVGTDMVDKYKQVAKQTATGYIVSALNIINEAEQQFKQARNKRLHVEMALIKLNFLHQAIQLTAQDNGTVVKKKRIDGPIAITQKNIPSIAVKPVNPATATTSKLYIQQPIVDSPKPIVATTANASIPSITAVATTTTPIVAKPIATTSNTKASLLDTLRNKVGSNYNIQAVKEPIDITAELLQQFWQEFIQQLKADNKLTQASSFEVATLKVDSNDSFTIEVNSVLQQKFIEQEKMFLLEKLWQRFENRGINFSFAVTETTTEDVPLHLKLTSKQKFERMALQNPALKQLKDGLNLDIEM
jgi:DNA polymerase III subunit gamma/tau